MITTIIITMIITKMILTIGQEGDFGFLKNRRLVPILGQKTPTEYLETP